MIDETSDISNKEQCVIVMRWVDDSLDVHEDFIGLYSIDNTESQTLVKVIKDVLFGTNLLVQNIRGQCYYVESVMKGHKTGVAKVIRDVKPRAVYTHCPGGGGVMPYMCHKETCRRSGYTFWPSTPRQGVFFRA